MSQAGTSILLAAVMIALAIYLFLAPPNGFGDNIAYRITLPFVLVASAFSVVENLRTRTHMAQLVGAIRGMMGKRGVEATPEIKGEAIQILIESIRNGDESVRQTAAGQLANLTGESYGEDLEAWDRWWSENRSRFGK